jgi:hypothetical protein
MADLISREALLSELEERFDGHKNRSQRNVGAGFVEVHKEWAAMAMGVAESLAIVRCTPAVDAVEVVRCKDCKHSLWFDEFDVGCKCFYCSTYMGEIRLDDFCSYGERRTENEDG